MFKLALCSLVFGGYALASGGGDPGPTTFYQVNYECTTKKEEITVKLGYTGTNSEYVPMENVLIKGLDKDIEFNTNWILKDNIYGKYQTQKQPEGLGNSSFQMKESGMAGYAFYRNDNNHVEIYSDHRGSRSNTLDIFIFDLNRKTKRVFTKVPCVLTVETFER